MGLLDVVEVELVRADAERVLLDEEEADRLAREAPQMPRVVAFDELGALGEQVVDPGIESATAMSRTMAMRPATK